MRNLKLLLGLFALSAILGLPSQVVACPSCADAPAATSGTDDDGSRNPAAYNNSIYLMVGVPYLTLGVLGFLVYRGMKKNDEFGALTWQWGKVL